MMGYTPGTAGRRDQVVPYVEFWYQPNWRWLIAETYWLWVRKSYWFMKHVETWHKNVSYFFVERVRRLSKEELSDWRLDYIPLTNRQDLREYDLSSKSRTVLMIVNLTREQYLALTRGPAEDAQPHVMVPTREGVQ